MENISNNLSNENRVSLLTNNLGDTSLLSYCKTCNVIGDDKVITYHKYNCPKKKVPCNKCLKEIAIQEIAIHKNICEEQEVQHYFTTDMFDGFMIKKSVLSSIELAEEILNGNYSVSESEKIKIYKQAIISYNKLIDKFNSRSCRPHWIPHRIISHNEYEKIINENIKLEKNQLSLQTTKKEATALDKNIEDEITINYLQKKTKYKIYDLPEVEITIGDLLHIKKAEVKASCNSSNAMDNPNIADFEDDLLFYQQAIIIYKELITNLRINKHRERNEFNKHLDLISKIKTNNMHFKTYSVTEKIKIKVPEKPLITTNFNLRLFEKADIDPRYRVQGKIFSLLSVNNLKNEVLGTFKINLKGCPHDITIKINSTPSYHTDEDTGIYLLLTSAERMGFGGDRHDAVNTTYTYTYTLVVSYIDKEDYKNFMFHVSVTAKELYDNLCCTDEFDKTTKFGFSNRSKKMKQLNRFFNADGIGTEHIKKYGCDSIFAIEFYQHKL